VSYPDKLEDNSLLGLCRFRSGDDLFGIDAFAVLEVVDGCEVRKVPRAPKFVVGVLAYRGEVLLAVSLRVLLGLAPGVEASSAMVLRDTQTGELFALLVDQLLDVVTVADDVWEPNPATLDDRLGLLFSGVYRAPGSSLVRLDPQHLQPSWLMQPLDSGPRIGGPR
jgi:purine-binding chemotaxis protein CheW